MAKQSNNTELNLIEISMDTEVTPFLESSVPHIGLLCPSAMMPTDLHFFESDHGEFGYAEHLELYPRLPYFIPKNIDDPLILICDWKIRKWRKTIFLA
ncbi:MAG: hypothetical protein H8E26_14835 [FCB group bacterium]|nr:hypothetical protein [FCB group bacterium]MBL7029439.1 hypothetical protein [Candidatus Neomarinimicrobiota bacterium]MBL7123163.1 hypothetical protein [Candidatus Neomarinimicrobiota bacterium]